MHIRLSARLSARPPAGMGSFDETDSRSLHMLGMHGSVYANYAMQQADVIIALGEWVRPPCRESGAAELRAQRECSAELIRFTLIRASNPDSMQVRDSTTA